MRLPDETKPASNDRPSKMTEKDSAHQIPIAIIRVGWLSLGVNIGLVAVKLTLSFATGSLALRADSIHSMVDVFVSIALIVGLFSSGRRYCDASLTISARSRSPNTPGSL